LPSFNLPLPAKIAIGFVVGIILLIVVLSIFSGRDASKAQPFISVLARGQETLRVTKVAQQLNFQDPQTQALATTVTNSLSSDQAQLIKYMATYHLKYSKQQLAADTDKTEDSSLNSAAQNNSLDTAYISYLKTALARYQADLKAAYKVAGPVGKQLLSESYDSASALLNSAPLTVK